MKTQLRLAAFSAALLILSGTFPAYAGSSDILPESLYIKQETVTSGDPSPSIGGTTAPAEAPAFSAHVEFWDGQGYVVRGTFTEFLPETSLVRTLYSLDGETWQTCQIPWNLQWLHDETPDGRKSLQNQTCLTGSEEPLAGYMAGELDCFYLKLQVTLANGITYETQSAIIDRGGPQPLPDGLNPVANFAPAIRIRQWRPFKSYGQYQITVPANAGPEDISPLLPDTLPIDIQLYEGIEFITNVVVDCPVTWKPLSLSRLTPGENVVIEDAAEDIIIPAGTLLNTPTGSFQLNEPLGFAHDEIRLILNVVAEDAEPAGALHDYFAGLEISFDLKPTGATSIQAYTLSEGESKWVEVPEPLLPEKFNAPSSSAGSLLTFVLTKDSEPYRSWLAAWSAGGEPVPFLVGLMIEGGVYDGRQLILAFPDTYEIPRPPPNLNGSGGNEDNAGAGNKNDSTPEGQRPELPQSPADGPDTGSADEDNTQKPGLVQPPKDGQASQKPGPSQLPEDAQKPLMPDTVKPPADAQTPGNAQVPEDAQRPEDDQIPGDAQAPVDAQIPGDAQTPEDAQIPGNAQVPEDAQIPGDAQAPEDSLTHGTAQIPEDAQTPEDAQMHGTAQTPKDTQKPQTPETALLPKEAQNTLPRQPAAAQPLIETPNAFSMDDTISARLAEAGDTAGVPAADTDNGSLAWEKAAPGTGDGSQRGLSGTAVIAVCIAGTAGTITAGSLYGRLSGKIIRALHRLLHQK